MSYTQDIVRKSFSKPLEGSSQTLELKRDGSLVVEWYDYGKAAQEHFGNDVAFILNLSPDAVLQLARELGHKPGGDKVGRKIIKDIKAQCANYHEFKKFCEEHEIPMSQAFDGWA